MPVPHQRTIGFQTDYFICNMDAEVGFEPTSLGYEPSKATTPPLRNKIVVLG